jgi:hypothetical protein|tara:strand:+ start:364 stop:1266 length:903 start_codon:yes stop_codon:yes gene_type:complete
MRVAVIEDTANHEQYKQVLESFAKGSGGEITNSDNVGNYDCAVIFGSYKKERGRAQHKGKGKIIESGMPYVQLETQLIGRPIDTAFHTEFRVGVNGFLWDDANWGFGHIEQDRSKKVFGRNGYDPTISWKEDGEYILLCMQKVGDASLRGADVFEWTWLAVERLRQHTQRKIVIRPHPLYRKSTIHQALQKQLLKLANVHWQEADVTKPNFIPIEEQLKNAWCTVTYSSGTGIDAVINGVPNVACDTGSMAYEVSSKDIAEIEKPFRGDKLEWANKIAHCQWSIEEFKSGECWEHVSKSI